jgi:hypothetical protein
MHKETFIPFTTEIILEKQLDLFETEVEKQQFKKLFHILEHYYHYEGFNLNQQLKQNYAFFDPDRLPEEKAIYKEKSNLHQFKETFQKVLNRGNFNEVTHQVPI